MDVTEVTSHHPAAVQHPQTSREGARVVLAQVADVGNLRVAFPLLKEVLGYHCLLVDVVDIHQVAAERTVLH